MPALTGLRFFLALWVVLHHLTGEGQMLEGWLHRLPLGAQRLLHGGYLAVGTFFVLSGFVMSLSYRHAAWTRRNLLRYGVARVGRIYPAYLVSLLIVLPWMLDYSQPNKAALLANYGLVLQGWTGNLGVSWNTPAWSLSCEFFFYLCFPLAVTLLGGRGWRTMALVIAACLILPVVLKHFGVPPIWKPIYRLGDFLIGIAVAGLYSALSATRLGGRGFWLYFPAISIGAFAVAYPITNRFTIDQIMRPVNAALILGLALGGGLAVRALAAGWISFLGQASYSMYIVHIPLLWWYRRLCFDQNPFLSKPEAAVLFLLATIGVSALMLRWIEEPANRGIRRWAEVRYGS